MGLIKCENHMCLHTCIYRDSYSVQLQHSFHSEEAQVVYFVFAVQDLSGISAEVLIILV